MNSTWGWGGKYSVLLHPLEMHLSLVSSVTAAKIIHKILNTGYAQTLLSPLPGRAKIPPLWDIFNLLFRSWVYFCPSFLTRFPSLPISGCSWEVLYKWHKPSLVFLKSFSPELVRWSLGLETSSDSCGCPAGNCWDNYSIPGIATSPFFGGNLMSRTSITAWKTCFLWAK